MYLHTLAHPCLCTGHYFPDLPLKKIKKDPARLVAGPSETLPVDSMASPIAMYPVGEGRWRPRPVPANTHDGGNSHTTECVFNFVLSKGNSLYLALRGTDCPQILRHRRWSRGPVILWFLVPCPTQMCLYGVYIQGMLALLT